MKYNLEDLEEIRDLDKMEKYKDVKKFVVFKDKKDKTQLLPFIGNLTIIELIIYLSLLAALTKFVNNWL